MKRIVIMFAAALLAAQTLLAYVVVLKDGSKIFARSKYEVRGSKAIITLENGTITEISAAQIDVGATERYNKEVGGGNVLAIETPSQQALPQPKSNKDRNALEEYIRKQRALGHEEHEAAPKKEAEPAAVHETSAPIDPNVAVEFSRAFDSVGLNQYRLTNTSIGPRLIVTTNSEQAAFSALEAAAHAVANLATSGRSLTVDLLMSTTGGENAGHFRLDANSVRPLTSGQITPQDFFVKNVIL
jgi:hypothetical protein